MTRRTGLSRDVDPLWQRILQRYRFRHAHLRRRVALVLRRAHAAPLAAAAARAPGERRASALSFHVHLSWPGWWVCASQTTVSPQTRRLVDFTSRRLPTVQVGRGADVTPRLPSAAGGSPFTASSITRTLTRLRIATIATAWDHPRTDRGSSARTPLTMGPRRNLSTPDGSPPRPPLDVERTPRMMRSPSVRTSWIEGGLIVRRRTELMTTRRQVPVSAGLRARTSASERGRRPRMVAAQDDRPGSLTGGGAARRLSMEGRAVAAPGPSVAPRFGPLTLESPRTMTPQPPTEAAAGGQVSPTPLYRHAVTRTLALAPPPQAQAASSIPAPGRHAQPPPAAAITQPAVPPLDVARLSEEVYRHIQRKIRIERERRGL